jgi:hypothetical protein
MSLLRLLTAGKTLVGLKKLEQRYHLPGGKALPQFGGKQNPFRATAFPEKTESSCPQEDLVVSGSTAAEMGGAQLKPEQELATQDLRPASSQSESTRVAKHLAAGSEKRSPFRALLLWGRAKRARPASGFGARPLVQAELSLDSVKVMRNDLSESDFEILPAGQVQRDAAAPQRRQLQDRIPELSKQ